MAIRLNRSAKKHSAHRWCAKFVLAALACAAASATSAETVFLDVEKDELTFGFIKLTDMAPLAIAYDCLLYTSPSPRDRTRSRMPSSA